MCWQQHRKPWRCSTNLLKRAEIEAPYKKHQTVLFCQLPHNPVQTEGQEWKDVHSICEVVFPAAWSHNGDNLQLEQLKHDWRKVNHPNSCFFANDSHLCCKHFNSAIVTTFIFPTGANWEREMSLSISIELSMHQRVINRPRSDSYRTAHSRKTTSR